MPSTMATGVTDVDAFRAAIRPAGREFLVTGRGRFLASVTKIDLPRLWTQSLRETLPRTWHVETRRVGVLFLTVAGSAATCRGVDVAADTIGLVHPGRATWYSLPGPTQTASMSLPEHEFAEIGAAITGQDFRFLSNAVTVAASPERLTRLRRLHAAATRVAETVPELIENPEVARGLEASLTEAMFACLAEGQTRTDTASLRQRRRIMKRFHALVEENPDQALYLSEICTAIGVAQRTLYNCCMEQLGVSPKRYLLLRRLHLARQALRLAPEAAKVTDIATQYGFWELGRFAVYYRSVFGEPPSKTLGSAYR